MKRILLLVCLLCLGATPIEKTPLEVRVKRLEDEMELRRKHVKTKFLTVFADMIFKNSGSGLPFGHMYTNTNQTITISDNNPTEITGGMTTGEVHLVTFGGSHNLKVVNAGKYACFWSISSSFAGAPGGKRETEGGLMINGTMANEGRSHRTMSNTADTGAYSSISILDLSADDEVSLFVQNEDSTDNIDLEHANLVILQIGG